MRQKKQQFQIRDVFLATTYVAVAVWLVSLSRDWPALGLIGIGALLFCVSHATGITSQFSESRAWKWLSTTASVFALGFGAPCILFGAIILALEIFN